MRTKPRILAVDDDDLVLESLKSELGANFELTTAQRANQALDFLEQESYDCVISDVRMPGMDGVSFLKEVGVRHPTVGRILITAFSDAEATDAAMYERGVFKVSKPWRDELEIAVRRALELRSMRIELDSNLNRFYQGVELERQFRQQTDPQTLVEQALVQMSKIESVHKIEMVVSLCSEETCLVTVSEATSQIEMNRFAPKSISLSNLESRFERQQQGWNYIVPLWDEDLAHYFLRCTIMALRQEELSWIDFIVEQLIDAMERCVLVKEVEHHRQLAENSLGQLANMEKMASLGLLSAGVAHEINNPAAYVRANLSVMEDYLHDLTEATLQLETIMRSDENKRLLRVWQDIKDREKLNETKAELQEMLVETREGVERIIDIAVNLKSFARRGIKTERKRIKVHQCMETSITMMRYRYKHNLEVATTYLSRPDVLGNSAEYSQVFLNLLLNAAQAMNGKGSIQVEIKNDTEWVMVTIADDGPGIDQQNLPHIFEPLFTTKEYGEGTGLGLSITKEIIERNGGSINVESQIGAGATFQISLPMVQEEPECI